MCGDCATTLPYLDVDAHCRGGGGHVACLHVAWVGVAHGQMTGSPQAGVRAEHTWAISDLHVGPRAAVRSF